MDEYVPFVETNALLCRPYTDGCDGWKLTPGWRVMTDSRGRVALEVRAGVETPFDMIDTYMGDSFYHDHDIGAPVPAAQPTDPNNFGTGNTIMAEIKYDDRNFEFAWAKNG